MSNRLTAEEQEYLDAGCRWHASPTAQNRAHLERAINAYNRAKHRLEDEKNETVNRLLLGIRRVA
jgi:predicted small metal-binding protein